MSLSAEGDFEMGATDCLGRRGSEAPSASKGEVWATLHVSSRDPALPQNHFIRQMHG